MKILDLLICLLIFIGFLFILSGFKDKFVPEKIENFIENYENINNENNSLDSETINENEKLKNVFKNRIGIFNY